MSLADAAREATDALGPFVEHLTRIAGLKAPSHADVDEREANAIDSGQRPLTIEALKRKADLKR